jgi:GTP-binding protein
MKNLPLVAIVGRPNTGKSTLFNRIAGERLAIEHPMPGMTRDRHYAVASYGGRQFTIVDTGGWEEEAKDGLLRQMREQTLRAIEDADRVIFLCDGRVPGDPGDLEIMERLRAIRRPTFLAVNKCDNERAAIQAIADFAAFGMDAVYPISGMHGDGVYDLLDAVTEGFGQPEEEEEDDGTIRVAIVGRQNVGKSTLVNRLCGEERVIASEVPGTTRDSVDEEVVVDGQRFTLIDTAGIRRRANSDAGFEKLTIFASLRAIERCEVALLVLDASQPLAIQDAHIAGYIQERRRSCILVVNKWDLVEDKGAHDRYVASLREHLKFMAWAPVITISAKTGQRASKLWELIAKGSASFREKYRTRDLNLVLQKASAFVSPPTRKGQEVRIKYVCQTGTRPPAFSFFCNRPELVHFSYRRFLENQFRMQLGIEGTPLRMRFRRKSAPRNWEKKNRGKDRPGALPPQALDITGEELLAAEFVGGEYVEDGADIAPARLMHGKDTLATASQPRFFGEDVSCGEDDDDHDGGFFGEDADLEDDDGEDIVPDEDDARP